MYMNDQLKSAMSEAQQAFLIGDYERTLNKCRLAFALNPAALGAYVLAGNACFVMGRPAEAEKYYRKAISLDEKNGEHYFSLGNCLTAQNKLQEALRCYADAEILKCSDKTRQKMYYAMGKINQQNGDFKNALLNYKKSESIPGFNPGSGDILLNCVEIYVAQGNWEDAENCATQLKLLMPDQFKNYQLLFQIMLQQKKTEQAFEVLTEAEKYCEDTKENRIEFIFDHAMIHCFLAEQYPDDMKKHFDDASAWLDKLNELDAPLDVNIEAKLTRADMQLKMKNRKAAILIAEEIAGLDNSELTEYIEKAQFIMIDCCRNEGNLQGVKKYAIKLKSSQNILYRHHGYYSEFWAANEMSKQDKILEKKVADLYDRAIAYYKQSSIENPGDFLAYVFRAQIYAETGKFEQAEKICEMLPGEAKTKLMEHIAQCRKSF